MITIMMTQMSRRNDHDDDAPERRTRKNVEKSILPIPVTLLCISVQ